MNSKYRSVVAQYGTSAPKVGDDDAVKATINKAENPEPPAETLQSAPATTRPEEPAGPAPQAPATDPTPGPAPVSASTPTAASSAAPQ
jgi:hypothetical protein